MAVKSGWKIISIDKVAVNQLSTKAAHTARSSPSAHSVETKRPILEWWTTK